VENEVRRLKEFNENIVQSMEEGILLENDEGLITFANPHFLKIIKIPRDRLIGSHFSEIFTPDSAQRVAQENSKLSRRERTRFEASLQSPRGDLSVLVSATPLMEGELYVGNLKVFADISERIEVEKKLRQRALRYKVEKGKSYLLTEKSLSRGADVFSDMLNAGYGGIVISRSPPEKYVKTFEGAFETIWLSEKGKGSGALPPDLNMVKKKIEDFSKPYN
jgi:PAS domain S-box-containing protein